MVDNGYKHASRLQITAELLPEPIRTSDPNKIEVLEMFSFSCIHCYQFEPKIQEWKKTLADDVNFLQSHVAWNEKAQIHARIFYTIQFLDVDAKTVRALNQSIFNAYNVERKKLTDTDEIADVFMKQGVSKKQFLEAFNSFATTNAMRMADARSRSYKVQGTPEMAVNGKYRVSGSLAGSNKEMLKVVDYLIELERKAGAKK